MSKPVDMSRFSEVRVDEQGREFVVYLPTGERYLLRKQDPLQQRRRKQPRKQRSAQQFDLDIPTRFVQPSRFKVRAWFVEGSGCGVD
jgi:hypothetical protein